MSGSAEVERTREGVPRWGGEQNLFSAYEEACYLYEASTAQHKRELCGPRLVAELTGAAKRMVAGRHPGWVAHYEGVRVLMEHLRGQLGRPQIPELTEHLSRYFKHCKRKPQESMNDYITRKAESYLRATQSLARVMKSKKKATSTTAIGTPPGPGSYGHNIWSGYSSRRSSWDQQSEYNEHEPNTQADENSEAQHTDYDTNAESDPWQNSTTATWSWSSYSWNQRPDWYGNYNWSWGWSPSQVGSSRRSEHLPEPSTREELLPAFIQGWYLLQDAGLNQTERNLVQTALAGNYEVDRVAEELRNQWSDADLRHRDPSRHSGFWGDQLSDDDEPEPNYDNTALMAKEDLNEEGLALLANAEATEQDALAAFNGAKRTLREARQRQHQVRMNRQYFRGSSRAPSGGSAGASSSTRGPSTASSRDANMVCLSCGKVGHRAANCPEPKAAAHMTNDSPQEDAPFVRLAEAQAPSDGQAEFVGATLEPSEGPTAFMGSLTTAEAVAQGHAIIDGGATKTLASVYAIERLMEANQKRHGSHRLQEVDIRNKPTFGFGNSSTDTCVSTVGMSLTAGGKRGNLAIHALQKGEAPILLSISTLRSLGAIIDFEHDLIAFRHLSTRKLIKAGRSATGHQLLSLADDLFDGALDTECEVPSLQAFLPKTG